MRNPTTLLATATLIALTGCASVNPGSAGGDSSQAASSKAETVTEGVSDYQGVVERCFGYKYGDNSYPVDPEKALRWCRELAERGSSAGQTLLAEFYYSGEGVDQDYKQALYWYTLAANSTQGQAALALFYMYFQGQGTARDNNTAFRYLARAVELGNETAKELYAGFVDEPVKQPVNDEQLQEMLKEREIVKVAPIYPLLAQQMGLEGYVIVKYCVDREGRTTNVQVVDSMPEGVFDAASVVAARLFLYRPEIQNGIAVERHGVVNKFTYELEK
tara:strand:- start:291 stop:1115 length:825 start_codon:yes stop_codon:yes gene_type:complete